MKQSLSVPLVIVASFLIGSALLGGIAYLWFPRADQIGDGSIIQTCREMGGEPTWIEWAQGCEDANGQKIKCYTEMCYIPK